MGMGLDDQKARQAAQVSMAMQKRVVDIAVVREVKRNAMENHKQAQEGNSSEEGSSSSTGSSSGTAITISIASGTSNSL